jgi:methionyl-tRNA synthetase
MGYDENLMLPYDIPANEYLRLKGEQFSKSRKTAVWVPDIIEKFEIDAVRYYISINMPENKDTNWMWDDFVAKNNDELVGAYGNFIHRVITFTHKNFGEIPKKGKLDELDKEAINKIKEGLDEVDKSLENCNFKKGLRASMNLAKYGNFYFDQKQPWTLVKNDKEYCGNVLHICLKIVNALAITMAPYLPFSSEKIWKILGNEGSIHKANWNQALDEIKIGTPLEKPQPLFKKLESDEFTEEEDPFSKLDLRVAQIIGVKDHPNADTLYMLHLDLGELGKRVIIAGMKPFYTKEEMTGKKIIIVTNLKPANIRGIKSNGMLLAADDSKGTCSLLDPGDVNPGTEVLIEGVSKKPASVLEFEDFKKVSMKIGEKQKAVYNGKILTAKNIQVKSDKFIEKGAKIL